MGPLPSSTTLRVVSPSSAPPPTVTGSPAGPGSASGLALQAVLADASAAPMTIPIGLDHVRRPRLRQTGADPVNGRSISELAVLGR